MRAFAVRPEPPRNRTPPRRTAAKSRPAAPNRRKIAPRPTDASAKPRLTGAWVAQNMREDDRGRSISYNPLERSGIGGATSRSGPLPLPSSTSNGSSGRLSCGRRGEQNSAVSHGVALCCAVRGGAGQGTAGLSRSARPPAVFRLALGSLALALALALATRLARRRRVAALARAARPPRKPRLSRRLAVPRRVAPPRLDLPGGQTWSIQSSQT